MNEKETIAVTGASQKTILVVDDEPDARAFLSICIESAGFKVETARDGEEALKKIEANPPDLITLDMIMPRKSGLQLMRELRHNERFVNLPVIVISAHSDDEFGSADYKNLISFASELKPCYTMEKPVAPERLIETISHILDVNIDQPARGGVTTTDGCENILFCSDFSDDADFAFSHAAYECKKYGARLHVMHVILSPASYSGPAANMSLPGLDHLDEASKKKKIEEQALLALKRHYEPRILDSIAFVFAVRFGSPDVQIINYATENDIGMIVLGVVGKPSAHRGRMLKTAANVAKYANCQVVTIGRSNR
ncbi:MAG: response regulator [Desulfobacterales bacterium]|jgi:two-component system alkaline phosphatase synthesis response regulator PhoP|nr:response regulator [Desulfobacterales bacterium]